MIQPWCNPLWLTGLKAPTNTLNFPQQQVHSMFCILFSCSFNQIMHFVSDTTLSSFTIYSIQKSENSAFGPTKIWIWSSFFVSMQNRWQRGFRMDLCTQSHQMYSGQFTSRQHQAGVSLVGWLEKAWKVYTWPKRHNKHDFFPFCT